MSSIQVSRSPVAAEFNSRKSVARFGLIALATDLTSEGDLARLLPQEGAALHVTRIAYENPTTPDNLRKMAPHLTAAAALLVPGEPLAAVCYSCTAASVVIGDAEISAAIQAVRPDVPVVTPTGAACMAFAALGIRRIAILTPYTIDTTTPIVDYFASHGFDITGVHCLGIEDDREMARVSDKTIVAAATAVDDAHVQVLFVSCTALPAVNVIAEIEQEIGKPVVTSNQASAWAMSRLGGFVDHAPEGGGKLFAPGLPAQDKIAAA